MDISVAYFHPLFHPDTVKRDFEQIRATGATSIVYALHEQEDQRWPRDLERGLQLAQEAGLKVTLSLGCYGNLFAGPSHVPSWYTFRHPETCVKDRHGRIHNVSCYNHEAFRSWFFNEIEYLLSSYPVNGILLDEPRSPDVTCFCSVCRALCPDITDLQHFQRRSFIEFLGSVFSTVKRVNSDVWTTLVLLPQDLNLLDELVTIPHLDTLGCHLFWQLLKEDISMVETWGRAVVEMARKHDKRSQLWLQNFHLDEEGERLLEASFTGLLGTEPDEMACYYYWRNNVNPEAVWRNTYTLLRRIPRRQLYWQSSTLSRITVPHLPTVKNMGSMQEKA